MRKFNRNDTVVYKASNAKGLIIRWYWSGSEWRYDVENVGNGIGESKLKKA